MGPCGPSTSWADKFSSIAGTWATIVLFGVVMGGIYFGVFTPTEAAGIGAFCALGITFLRGRLTWQTFLQSLTETGITTAMIFLIIIGANILSAFLGMTGLPMLLAETMAGLPLPRYAVLAAILLIFLGLGCVMDCYAIMILVLPILFPVVQALQFDPIWFGVIMVIVLEAGLITPPIGLNVFVLKGACPQVPVSTVFRGVWPFLLAMLAAIVLLTLFPQLALFIPSSMGRI